MTTTRRTTSDRRGDDRAELRRDAHEQRAAEAVRRDHEADLQREEQLGRSDLLAALNTARRIASCYTD